jgi:hypothetical protein
LSVEEGEKSFSCEGGVVVLGTSGRFGAFSREERKLDVWSKKQGTMLIEHKFHSGTVCLAACFQASARASEMKNRKKQRARRGPERGRSKK